MPALQGSHPPKRDGRDKPGHDEEGESARWMVGTRSRVPHPAARFRRYAAFARATSALYISSSSPSALAMLGRFASRAT